MKGVLITITSHDLACARRWGADCKRNVRGPNPTGLTDKDRFFKNFCAQLAWLRWCRIYGLRCMYRVVTDGHSVHDKFRLYQDGEPKECMVKTASYSWHTEMQMPVQQGVDVDALYIGMRVRCDADTDLDSALMLDVECCGMLPGDEVVHLPTKMVKVLTRYCPLNDLRPATPVRSTYDQGPLELRDRALELVR